MSIFKRCSKPILPEGGPSTMNPSTVATRSGLLWPKFLTLFLLIVARSQNASFGVCFSKNWKKWTSQIFGGPRALGENWKKSKKIFFLLTNPIFSSSIWIVHVLSFHLRCIAPLKLKIFEILNFSSIISIEICQPLAAKLRNLKLSKMAF